MIYNEEQWQLIKQASPHFETARRDYIRNAPQWLTEQIISVYEDATGKTIMSKNLTCAVCVLRIYQTVGKTYFADLDERNKIKEKELTKNVNESKQAKAKDGEPDGRSTAKNQGGSKVHKKRLAKK